VSVSGETHIDSGTQFRDKRRYFWLSQPLLPLLPTFSCWMAIEFNSGVFYWLTAIFWFGLVALLDQLLPKDSNNPPIDVHLDLEKDSYYGKVIFFAIPFYLLNFSIVCAFIANNKLGFMDYCGITVSMGIVSGLALAVGHEFGHKTSYRERTVGKIFLAIAGVGQFMASHATRHHVLVATPEDHASSRMGETLYHFGAKRQQPGFFRESWKVEKQRASRGGWSVWSLKNETLQQYLMTIGLFAALTIVFGWIVLPMLLIQMYICWWYLSLIEYCQHYGMKRDLKEDGSYKLATTDHSWNTNMLASNNLLLNFVRHSPHHSRATRWYQALRDEKQAPVLPYCYSLMFLAAMVPPLYFRLMDRRVVEWAGGDMEKINFHIPAEDKLRRQFAKNQ
jgi:alkane 1-monooxygenase